MHNRFSLIGLTLLSAALLVFLGCGGGYSSSSNNYNSGNGTSGGGLVTSITISPTTGSIAVGGTEQFMAKAMDSGGVTVASAPLTWTSSDTSVATVDGNGLATGVGTGTTSITASITYTSSGVYTTGPGTTYTSNMAQLTVATSIAMMGTAATGHAMAGAVITLKDADGKIQTALSDDAGRYSLSTAGLKAPYLLKADDGHGRVLFSAAAGGSVANLDTVTDVMLRAWYGAHGSTPEAAFADMRSNPAPDQKSLLALDRSFHGVLDDSLTAEGLDTSKFNLFSTPFKADSTGFDAVLDNLRAVTGGRLELQDKLMGRSTDVSGLGR
jgi:hypothetical protein